MSYPFFTLFFDLLGVKALVIWNHRKQPNPLLTIS